MQIVWTVKDKLAPVLVGHIPREIWRLKNSFLTSVEELKRRFFLHNTNHPQSHQEGLKYKVVKFSIYEEKSAILKHLQYLIDLNNEQLTPIYTAQNVIVEEELAQDYNVEDEDVVFTDNDNESDSDYDTGLIYHNLS